jgi:PAS domain S-box-containing protein
MKGTRARPRKNTVRDKVRKGVSNATLTERKLAEEQLDKYFALSLDLLCIADFRGYFQRLNNSWERALGYSLEELMARPFMDFVHPADREATLKEFEKIQQGGRAIQFENRYRRKDGSYCWLQWNATPVPDEHVVYALARDVSERMRTEEQRQLGVAAMEAAANGIVITDRDGIIIWSNPAFSRLTGFAADQVIGHHTRMLKSGHHPPEFYARLWATILAGKVWQGELINRRRNGSTYPEEMTITPVRDNRGEITHFIAIKLDITERRKAEAALALKTQELARSNSELEQFAYVASHDLQEPLRMVTSFLELLRTRHGEKLGQEADEFIGFAVDGAVRMRGLINDLLTYSRVGTHGKPFAPTNCSVVLTEALQNLKVALEESGAQVVCDPLPVVMADATQMTQLFQNLIGNAIKYRGGRAPEIHVGAVHTGYEWQFTVRDNGIGFDPQYRERIFGLFQRLHQREEYPGTGIGLAVCKKIVERHEGRIWAESTPSQGSTFGFTIPTKEAASDEQQQRER